MPDVYLLRCYGEPVVAPDLELLATQGSALQLAGVQQWAARHMREGCPRGTAPGAQVAWVLGEIRLHTLLPVMDVWEASTSAQGGEGLNHTVVRWPVPADVPPLPLKPCGSRECTRSVVVTDHCCAPCRLSREAQQRHEPAAHSPLCDILHAVRRLRQQ